MLDTRFLFGTSTDLIVKLFLSEVVTDAMAARADELHVLEHEDTGNALILGCFSDAVSAPAGPPAHLQ